MTQVSTAEYPRAMRLALDLPTPQLSAASMAAVDVERLRVGVYVDGVNLYYGGRRRLGRPTGCRWLDIRAMVSDLVADRRDWSGAEISRIVYCTARINQGLNPRGYAEQDAYLRALAESGSVNHIEFGKYVTGTRARPLAVRDQTRRGAPKLVRPESW